MRQPDFDRIARMYRWLEYLALGPLLELTRNRHIPLLQHCRRALILGDGDGRFTAQLLVTYPDLHAHVIDTSASMLALLRKRVGVNIRLRSTQEDARTFTPSEEIDLVVTHFFLDCLTAEEVNALIVRLAPKLVPNALWLVSDFRTPDGLLHWPARLYIRVLYLAFRILTGLRVTQLPDFASPLQAAGFKPIARHRTLLGLLTTEIWSAHVEETFTRFSQRGARRGS